MQSNYFHRSCNSTVRKFYEDFDLLPYHIKQLLWDNPTALNFDDLRAAWELAGENFSIDQLMNLNVFEKEREAKQQNDYENKKEQKRKEKEAARNLRWKREGRYQTYEWKRLGIRTDKHAALVKRVSDEEAMRLLTERKETKDVVAAGNTVVRKFTGWRQAEAKPEPEKYEKFIPQQHVCKMLHNSGGKR